MEWSDEFENGRQDVILDMSKSINKSLKFVRGALQNNDTKYSEQSLEAQLDILEHLEAILGILKTKRKDVNLIG